MISTSLIVILIVLAAVTFVAWLVLARRDGVESVGAVSLAIATLVFALYGVVSLAFNAGVPLDPTLVHHKLDALHAWAFSWAH